jgi:DNA-binding response OmpR family regulator
MAAICRERPDIILLDVMMPKMDGFEVCRRVKSNPGTALIYILMITSLAERKNRMKGIECGADDFLGKPVEPEEVLLRVRNAILSKQMMEELQEQKHQQAKENPLQNRLRSLSASDADLAIALLTVCTDMLIWRMAVGQLNKLERDQLRDVYGKLNNALGSPPTSPA